MTKQEIVTQLNQARVTLVKSQQLMVELHNQLLGCSMLLESLMAATDKLTVAEGENNAKDQAE